MRALTAAGHDVVAVDAMLTAAHGATARCRPRACSRSTSATPSGLASLLPGVDVVCHQAAVVGAGVDAADAPSYGSHNDYGTTVLLAEMYAAGAGGWCWPRRWWSTARAATTARSTVPSTRCRARAPTSTQGSSSTAVRSAAKSCEWRLVGEDAPLRPRSLYAASKTAQEHYALAWAEATGGSVVALRYHNVYGPCMPRDTPYSGVAAIFRSAIERGEPPRVFEDGGQMRDFVHVDDVAAANVAAVGSDADGFAAFNVCSGRPVSIMEVATRLCEARDGAAAGGHRSVPQRRRPPHRRRPRPRG